MPSGLYGSQDPIPEHATLKCYPRGRSGRELGTISATLAQEWVPSLNRVDGGFRGHGSVKQLSDNLSVSVYA